MFVNWQKLIAEEKISVRGSSGINGTRLFGTVETLLRGRKASPVTVDTITIKFALAALEIVETDDKIFLKKHSLKITGQN